MHMTINENEQWLSNGDCNKCRRKNYCGKPCTQHARAMKRTTAMIVSKAIANVIIKHF